MLACLALGCCAVHPTPESHACHAENGGTAPPAGLERPAPGPCTTGPGSIVPVSTVLTSDEFRCYFKSRVARFFLFF